jgi:RNA polymerase sigma factor (sigma-70 family)
MTEPSPTVPRLRAFVPIHVLEGLTDTDLLGRFAADNDETAFAVLVRRYGPLVLGVCRRVLHHDHDTEDAFQATFLVLARKAGTIHKHESLWSWLYKVAYRIALRARAGKARRQAQESEAMQRLTVRQSSPASDPYLAEFLDEEVRRLPDKYREPILLCYLQGETNEEAARRLHCPTGTVKIRLLRARQLLRKRLERRGVALSLAALAAGLLQHAEAAVPAVLAARTARAASLVGEGYSPMAAGLSSQVAGLVEVSLRRMCLTKLKVALAVLVAVLLCACTEGLTQPAGAADVMPAKSREMAPKAVPSYDSDSPLPGARFAALRKRGR